MNPSDTIPSTQMILSWTLLGVLFAWMLFCAILAFRPRKESRETTDLPTPSGVFSVSTLRSPYSRSTVSADVSLSGVPAISNEASRDVGVAPVA